MARAPTQSTPLSPPQTQSQSASLWKHAWRRLRRNKLAVAGGIILKRAAADASGGIDARMAGAADAGCGFRRRRLLGDCS